jgi:glycosyltransferase involved in cell wall biosynthesis
VRDRRAADPSLELAFDVIENPFALGVTKNFEQAVSRCTGDLIALCDQDDIWHPDKLLRIGEQFEQHPELSLVFTDARLIDAAGAVLRKSLFESLEVTREDRAQVNSGQAFETFLRRNLATGATVVFRRALLEEALPFPAEWLHDEWLAVMAAAHGSVRLLDEDTVDYRQHEQNEVGVRAPTLAYKIGRVLARRGSRNDRLARQFRILAERLAVDPSVTPQHVGEADEKAKFERMRADLPVSRIRRWSKIRDADRRGMYKRYASRRRMDVLRDALQAG